MIRGRHCVYLTCLRIHYDTAGSVSRLIFLNCLCKLFFKDILNVGVDIQIKIVAVLSVIALLVSVWYLSSVACLCSDYPAVNAAEIIVIVSFKTIYAVALIVRVTKHNRSKSILWIKSPCGRVAPYAVNAKLRELILDSRGNGLFHLFFSTMY